MTRTRHLQSITSSIVWLVGTRYILFEMSRWNSHSQEEEEVDFELLLT
jgi:hypothetical protein